MTADPTPTPAPDARPVADVMRELADAATDGRVTVHADTVRAWADEIEALEATKRELLTHILNMPSDHFGHIDIPVANWLGAGIRIIKHYGIPLTRD